MEEQRRIVIRFTIVYLVVVLGFLAVIAKAIYIQAVERTPLLALAAKTQSINDTVALKSERGNIYSADGRLLSASIPTYFIRMDTKAAGLDETYDKINGKKVYFDTINKKTTRYEAKLDSTAAALASLFGGTKQDYKTTISRARAKGDRSLKLFSEKISHVQLNKVRQMPLFRYSRYGINLGGLYVLNDEKFIERVNPYGSLAARTLGAIWGADQYEKDTVIDPKTGKQIIIDKKDKITGERIITFKKGSGRYGLEKFFDSQLTGKNGYALLKNIADGKNIVTKKEPTAGNDVYTTIDVDIQDLAEAALRQNLDSLNAQNACAIVMKTSGEIVACVNLFRTANGYFENDDMIFHKRYDVGSTFKIVSMMIALEKGFVKPNDIIKTDVSPYGVGDLHVAPQLTAAEIIAHSSNIGISNIITKNYINNPQQFFEDIYKTGFLDTMRIQIPDMVFPSVYRNKTASNAVQVSNIARISFGQSIVVPPIYTLRFYNAIANGGKMVEPRLVSSIRNGNEIVEVFDSKIINPKICSDSTLKTIQAMLEGVVNDKGGTGYKEVRSNIVKIAGKTGTADIEKETKNFASFCGYFPADNPKYTVIVAAVVPHRTYGAGAAGRVFKKIAEGITNMRLNTTAQNFISDSTNLANIQKIPHIKDGSFAHLKTVADRLKFSLSGNNSEWVTATTDSNFINTKPISFVENLVPNVCGMGAKDAIYLLEKAGLRVNIAGRGKVVAQTILPDTRIKRGETVLLKLE